MQVLILVSHWFVQTITPFVFPHVYPDLKTGLVSLMFGGTVCFERSSSSSQSKSGIKEGKAMEDAMFKAFSPPIYRVTA